MASENKSKIENDIAAYLLEIGYSPSKVQEVMLRHRFKGKRAARLLAKNMSAAKPVVLNLGCGSGMNHCHLIKEIPSADIYGIDVDGRAVELCRRYNPEFSDKISEYDGKIIPFRGNFFDGVLCDTVIEHVENPDLLLKEIYRVLKYGGFLFITTANKLWPLESHYNLFALSWLPGKWADRYMRLAGLKKNHYDVNLPTYGRFVKQLKRAGFKIYDATFDVMENPELYESDKERPIMRYLKPLARVINLFPRFIKYAIEYLNFGWIIIAKKY